MNKFKIKEVNRDGITRKVIEYDGRIFIQPLFHGQAVGWVRERFGDMKNSLLHILLITPEDWNLWYTLNFCDSDRMEIGYPDVGAPLYFQLLKSDGTNRKISRIGLRKAAIVTNIWQSLIPRIS